MFGIRGWWLCVFLCTFSSFTNVVVQGRTRGFGGEGVDSLGTSQWSDSGFEYNLRECQSIPQNMSICHEVGYRHMILPNYFQHESLREVVSQASEWQALVNTQCHPDLRRFLCSLYAPVCVKNSMNVNILPCQSLCRAVQQPCAKIMREYHFSWPPQLACERFPKDDALCVPVTEGKSGSLSQSKSEPNSNNSPGFTASSENRERTRDAGQLNNCPLCSISTTANKDILLQHFCQADIVVKATIRQITSPGNTIHLGRKVMMFKPASKDFTGSVQSILGCTCPPSSRGLTAGPNKWFIAGNLVQSSAATKAAYQISYIFPWNREQKEFKQSIRRMRRQGVSLCKELVTTKEVITPTMAPLPQVVDDNRGPPQQEKKRKGGKRQKPSNNGK